MPENCRLCGNPLIRLHWNDDADVLTCNTSACRAFRQPIAVPPGGITDWPDKVRKRRLKRGEGASLEERLQELRDNFPA